MEHAHCIHTVPTTTTACFGLRASFFYRTYARFCQKSNAVLARSCSPSMVCIRLLYMLQYCAQMIRISYPGKSCKIKKYNEKNNSQINPGQRTPLLLLLHPDCTELKTNNLWNFDHTNYVAQYSIRYFTIAYTSSVHKSVQSSQCTQ